MNDLMVVEQLPIITENLQTVAEKVAEQVQGALSCICTEETVKDVKAVRSALNKEFKGYEEERKAIKSQVLAPYEAFEKVYKNCIADVFTKADKELKQKIDDVETGLKNQKKAVIEEYFNEACKQAGIGFLSFDRLNISVGLSSSEKALKQQVASKIDGIIIDLTAIKTSAYADEILFEYKKSLNLAEAIAIVTERKQALEPKEETPTEKAVEAEQTEEAEKLVYLSIKFTACGTVQQITELKKYLQFIGIAYDFEI